MIIKKMAAILTAAMMVSALLAGCGSSGTSDAGNAPASGAESKDGASNGFVELTMLIDTDVTAAGLQAVCDLAEEKLGIHVTMETRPGGADGDNIVKTRLASGDMADLCAYNSGALLNALNPSEYFIDLSNEELASRLDDTYKSTVTVDGAVYGIPMSSTQAGAVIYNKDLYAKYNLTVPKTWDEFMANCKVLKDAGETAVISGYSDSWTA